MIKWWGQKVLRVERPRMQGSNVKDVMMQQAATAILPCVWTVNTPSTSVILFTAYDWFSTLDFIATVKTSQRLNIFCHRLFETYQTFKLDFMAQLTSN